MEPLALGSTRQGLRARRRAVQMAEENRPSHVTDQISELASTALFKEYFQPLREYAHDLLRDEREALEVSRMVILEAQDAIRRGFLIETAVASWIFSAT